MPTIRDDDDDDDDKDDDDKDDDDDDSVMMIRVWVKNLDLSSVSLCILLCGIIIIKGTIIIHLSGSLVDY